MLFPILLSSFLSHQHVEGYMPKNWTTCEDFLRNSTFDYKSVLNVDWKIFYFWNFEFELSYNIRFSEPTRELIERFRVALNDELKHAVNWTRADLFMETSIDFSALFIRTDKSGMYSLVPSIAFEVKSTPSMVFAMKVVEPGYLCIVNCKHHLTYALAPVDNMPHPDLIEQAASKIGYKGEFGRSYLIRAPQVVPPPSYQEFDDADDDVEMEIDHNINKLED